MEPHLADDRSYNTVTEKKLPFVYLADLWADHTSQSHWRSFSRQSMLLRDQKEYARLLVSVSSAVSHIHRIRTYLLLSPNSLCTVNLTLSHTHTHIHTHLITFTNSYAPGI